MQSELRLEKVYQTLCEKYLRKTISQYTLIRSLQVLCAHLMEPSLNPWQVFIQGRIAIEEHRYEDACALFKYNVMDSAHDKKDTSHFCRSRSTYNLALSYKLLKRFDEARYHYIEFIRGIDQEMENALVPNHRDLISMALESLAEIELHLDHMHEACEWYWKILKRFGEDRQSAKADDIVYRAAYSLAKQFCRAKKVENAPPESDSACVTRASIISPQDEETPEALLVEAIESVIDGEYNKGRELLSEYRGMLKSTRGNLQSLFEVHCFLAEARISFELNDQQSVIIETKRAERLNRRLPNGLIYLSGYSQVIRANSFISQNLFEEADRAIIQAQYHNADPLSVLCTKIRKAEELEDYTHVLNLCDEFASKSEDFTTEDSSHINLWVLSKKIGAYVQLAEITKANRLIPKIQQCTSDICVSDRGRYIVSALMVQGRKMQKDGKHKAASRLYRCVLRKFTHNQDPPVKKLVTEAYSRRVVTLLSAHDMKSIASFGGIIVSALMECTLYIVHKNAEYIYRPGRKVG